MSKTKRIDTINFTIKGQIVIPNWLRKEFDIKEGTRALIYQDDDTIVIKPMTAKHYKSLRGSLKGKNTLEILEEGQKEEQD